MPTPRISRTRQLRFLAALTKSGNVVSAAIDAHVEREELEQARRANRTFAKEWKTAQRAGAKALEREALRRALHGVPEPVVNEGKVVRDDHGRPMSVQRYSDALLIEILRRPRPWNFAFESFWRGIKLAALVFLIAFVLLAAGSLAFQWLESHLIISTRHSDVSDASIAYCCLWPVS
jgi:hypothetical protein